MIFATPNRGTGGAGARGILQGMIAGQQSRESDQKMQWLKTNQDRQTEKYESNENNERLYNMREVNSEGGNLTPLVDSYNKWRSTTTNFADGNDFTVSNWDNFRNDAGQVNTAAQNQWTGDTGFQFDENTTKRNPLMLGDKFFNFETFSAGSPKFKTYARDKDIARAVQLKKNKEGKGPGNMELIKTLRENPNRTEDEDKELRALRAKEGILKSHAVSNLNSESNDNLYKAVTDEDISALDDQTINKAITNEIDAGLGEYKDSEKIGPGIASVDTLTSIAKQLEELPEGNIAEGMKESGLIEAAKYLNSKEFSDLKPDQQRKYLQTIQSRSGLGIAATKILQSISGQAVPDTEYERFMTNLVGGDINNVNKGAIVSALRGASESLYGNVKANIKSSVPKTRAGTRAQYFKNLENVWNPVDRKVTKGGTKTLEEAPKEVISGRRRDAAKLAKAAGLPDWAVDLIDVPEEVTKKVTANTSSVPGTTQMITRETTGPDLANANDEDLKVLLNTMDDEESQAWYKKRMSELKDDPVRMKAFMNKLKKVQGVE